AIDGRVERLAAALLALDQTAAAQTREMLGDVRLREPGACDDLADAQLAAAQLLQDREPRGIGQRRHEMTTQRGLHRYGRSRHSRKHNSRVMLTPDPAKRLAGQSRVARVPAPPASP